MTRATFWSQWLLLAALLVAVLLPSADEKGRTFVPVPSWLSDAVASAVK